jgi:hypothetical protein
MDCDGEDELRIRLEIPDDEYYEGKDVPEDVVISTSLRKRELSLKIPEGLELSEEEMNAIIEATQNEIIDILSGKRAKNLGEIKPLDKARQKAKVCPRHRKYE